MRIDSPRCKRCLLQTWAVSCLMVVACAPRTSISMLVHMIKDQEDYFRREVVPVLEKKSRVRLSIISCGSVDSIEAKIEKNSPAVGLVKVPFELAIPLAEKGWFIPLDTILFKEEIREFTDTYLLTSLGKWNDTYYYIPRKFETNIMAYSISKVADAVARWQEHREAIEGVLKNVNGIGLPRGYTLEEDPNQWDYFDIFVAGWTWAHTAYGGKTVARIAHRGKRYLGTALRLVDCVFQCGGDSVALLTMKGDAVVDAFRWEAVYAWANIYNKRMWEESWEGTEIWRGFGNGEIFLAFINQLDCFFIHGTGRDGLNGFLADPNDFGVAVMPLGSSIDLDTNGMPQRVGRRAVTTGGWWWGIPRTTPNPRLSYEVARLVTGPANQIQECSRFGMIPVRKDILSQISMMFGSGWISNVYQTSFKQLVLNGTTTIPSHAAFDRISAIYLDAWFDIVVGKNWSEDSSVPPDQSYIKRVLLGRYHPKALAILGRGK